jgi:hypothetical protein
MPVLIAILYSMLYIIAVHKMQRHPITVIVNATSYVRSKR